MYASLGMTVVVPVALLASLTVLAFSGGIPGLGSLRQALSGPSAPTLAPPVLGDLSTRSRGGLLSSSRSAALAPGVAPSAALAGAGARGGSHGTAGPGGSPGVGRPGTGGEGSVGGGGSYSGSPRPSGGRPSPSPTAANRIVRTVTPVTSGLPAPVGTVVTQALKSAGSLANRVLQHLPGR